MEGSLAVVQEGAHGAASTTIMKAAAGNHDGVEAPGVAKQQQVQGSCGGCSSAAAGVLRGIQKLISDQPAEEACRIVNKTGKAVVVRAKYKEVWEGPGWRLAAEGGEMVVPAGLLKSSQPYCRLGAFFEPADCSTSFSAPLGVLYISCRDFLACPRIILSLCA